MATATRYAQNRVLIVLGMGGTRPEILSMDEARTFAIQILAVIGAITRDTQAERPQDQIHPGGTPRT